VGNKPVKDVIRADMLRFAVWLREEKNQSPRSCANKFDSVLFFLRRHDLTAAALKITAHDRPQFVQEEPDIYDQETLDKFFAACDEDERTLFELFLMSGLREQEVTYATDRSPDFANCAVRVKHNPKYNWTPKA
ncbi:MAG: hypothetical protein WB795_05570, partial [Candidatus Acidiferrales bacterium]